MKTIQEYEDYLTRQEAREELLQDELDRLASNLVGIRKDKADLEKARDIANTVLLLTQEQVKAYVDEIVTLALSSVYPGYSFELEYTIKRNQSEATPWIIKDGDRFSPREEVGGGVLDIASLGMRLAMWSLMEPKPAPIFILDEPAKFVSRDRQADFGSMLHEISKMLGVQIIMVSHSTDIIEQADMAYEVIQNKGVSKVTKVE